MNVARLLTGSALSVLLALASTAALAQEGPCITTARDMAKACRNDADEEEHIAEAICRNIGNAADRSQCFDDADATKDEEEALCNDSRDNRFEVCDALGDTRYNPPWRPADYVDPDDVGDTVAENPYLSLVPGRTQLIVAGEDSDETVVEYVTAETKRFGGVDCRVVKAVEFEGGTDYDLTELTDDWYAQHVNGDIWYCGELARNYEDGDLVDLDGSFRAFQEGAKPGIVMPAAPQIGDAYRQEWALDEAEDFGEVLDTAGVPDEEVAGFECAPGGCLVVFESNPDEPDVYENKYFLMGTGFVQAIEFEDDVQVPGREELVCVGDTLESCVTDADLLDALCEADPATFCP